MRAPIPLLAATVAVALLLPACGDDGGPRVASLVEGEGEYEPATTEQAAAGAAVITKVGTDLYAPIAAEAGDGNIAFSPLSIASVLAMTRVGADGASAEQLDAFLGTGTDGAPPASVMGAAQVVEDHTGPVQLDDGEMGEIDLTNANALWGQSGVEWQQPFLDELKTGFDTGMWMADYIEDPDNARREINDWVAEHTREHITELLPKGSITEDTRLTLTNAIWFKAPWPGELDDAGEQPFTTATGDEVTAPMLTTTGDYGFQEGDGWQAVALPYAGGSLALALIVPDAGRLEAVEQALGEGVLVDALEVSEPVPLRLSFPKFDLDQKAALGDALKGLGVTAPFENGSDFEPMTTDDLAQPLLLTDVLHQATVTVDEHGTEAAAATAATFETVGGPIVEQELLVDRPFLFVIHDRTTGTPLFLGRVTNPMVT
ncbi:serpin family protein [Aquihabitans daechungensis]|uniref:serpin family protein n=1 Tax=Aquihabitans daechungensis TaxID=1052257 RepID=UPI003BA0DF10